MELDMGRRAELESLLSEMEGLYIRGVPESKIAYVTISDMVRAVNDYLDDMDVEDDEELLRDMHMKASNTLARLALQVMEVEFEEKLVLKSSNLPDANSIFKFAYALSFRRYTDVMPQGDCQKFIRYVRSIGDNHLDKIDPLTWKFMRVCVATLMYLDFSTLSLLSRLLLKQAALEVRC